MAKSTMKYVGVDGCKGGWLAVGFDDTDHYEVKGFMEFSDLVDHFGEADLILVDMPIGLNSDTQDPKRACDTEARKILGRLGGISGSVFPPPNCRLAYGAMSGEVEWPSGKRELLNRKVRFTSNRTAVPHDWGKVSRQTFSIACATGEVNDFLKKSDNGEFPVIREVHPEVCFRLLGTERAITDKKSTRKGLKKRKRILRCYEPLTDHVFRHAQAKFRNKGTVGDDDILDALVAAVTAKLGCQDTEYELRKLPDKSPTNWNESSTKNEMLYVIKREHVTSGKILT